MKIKDLKNIINNQFLLVHKSIGVELVGLGFLNYTKLTPKNYDYWWYEVQDLNKINKKSFTFDWNDLQKTKKFKWIEKLIDYHEDNESMFVLITNILNIVSALNDGINQQTKIPCWVEVYNFYYKHKSKKEKQLKLF